MQFFKSDFTLTAAILFCSNITQFICKNTCVQFLFTHTGVYTMNSPDFNYTLLPSDTENGAPST